MWKGEKKQTVISVEYTDGVMKSYQNASIEIHSSGNVAMIILQDETKIFIPLRNVMIIKGEVKYAEAER